MRFSVGQYTTARATFEEDVRIYAEAGAEGVGIDLGLKPIDVAEGVHIVAPFRPATVVFGTGPYLDDDPVAGWSHAVQGFKRVAREAAGEGLTVALEPLHSTLSPHWTFLTDLATTVRLVEEIDEPNLGFLFDVWHLWDSPDVHELLRANVERVFAVHVDDWRDPTRSWADRVLPGDGLADIEGFLRILAEGGYDGWLELEIFSDDGLMGTAFPDSLYLRDPVELVRDGRLRTERLWARATTSTGA